MDSINTDKDIYQHIFKKISSDVVVKNLWELFEYICSLYKINTHDEFTAETHIRHCHNVLVFYEYLYIKYTYLWKLYLRGTGCSYISPQGSKNNSPDGEKTPCSDPNCVGVAMEKIGYEHNSHPEYIYKCISKLLDVGIESYDYKTVVSLNIPHGIIESQIGSIINFYKTFISLKKHPNVAITRMYNVFADLSFIYGSDIDIQYVSRKYINSSTYFISRLTTGTTEYVKKYLSRMNRNFISKQHIIEIVTLKGSLLEKFRGYNVSERIVTRAIANGGLLWKVGSYILRNKPNMITKALDNGDNPDNYCINGWKLRICAQRNVIKYNHKTSLKLSLCEYSFMEKTLLVLIRPDSLFTEMYNNTNIRRLINTKDVKFKFH